MNKKEREIVYNKYGGKCAYCGCELTKGWHADHANNVHRYKDRETGEAKMFYPENDCLENMMPSCPSCNIYKGGCSLDIFRMKMNKSVSMLNKNNAQYRFAKRFGLIKESNKPVVFYFETVECQNVNPNNDMQCGVGEKIA